MPNGGSDCCGTCWFNTRNQGQAGYGHADSTEPALCEIRGRLPIVNPFWTYCANHPHHNPDRVQVPIGPVYVCGDEGYARKVWMPPPDTEEVRVGLLAVVRAATPGAARSYPGGLSLVEAAIVHLGELREPRALPELDRLLGFPEPTESARPFGTERVVELARRAAAQIVPPEELAPFRTPTVCTIAAGIADTGDWAAAPILADALEEVGCRNATVLDYLRAAAPREGRSWVIGLLAAADSTG
jgi:hypothetical protein